MITEDYVSFETAKLLKEKGFNENTPVNYFIGDDKPRGCAAGEMIYHKRAEEDTHLIACPTLQMAMKWLREVHNIHVVPKIDFYAGDYTGRIYDGRRESTEEKDDYIAIAGNSTYEQAAEAAIKYCLKYLI